MIFLISSLSRRDNLASTYSHNESFTSTYHIPEQNPLRKGHTKLTIKLQLIT